jgi:molybdate transport system substrate-binding protein
MSEQKMSYGQKNKWPLAAMISLVFIAGLFAALKQLSQSSPNRQGQLIIYCAAALKLPISEITKAYTAKFGIPVSIEYGSSGELETKLQQDANYKRSRAHLYIPADSSFSKRTKAKGLTFQSLAMARFKLVLAVKVNDPLEVSTFKEFLDQGISFAICSKKAGAGKKTMDILKQSGDWQKTKQQRKVVTSKVTECASAVKTVKNLRAGIIWSTTALQFDLRVIELPEFAHSDTKVNVNITNSHNNAKALQLARYLSSSENAQKSFAKYGFQSVATP